MPARAAASGAGEQDDERADRGAGHDGQHEVEGGETGAKRGLARAAPAGGVRRSTRFGCSASTIGRSTALSLMPFLPAASGRLPWRRRSWPTDLCREGDRRPRCLVVEVDLGDRDLRLFEQREELVPEDLPL